MNKKKTTINKDMKDNFSEIIRKKLENYSVPQEIDDSWSEIEKQLAAREKRKIPLWPWITGLSVAAAVTVIWMIFPFNKQFMYYENTSQLSNDAKAVTPSVFEEETLSEILPSDEFYAHVSHQERRNTGKTAESTVFEPDVINTEQVDKQENIGIEERERRKVEPEKKQEQQKQNLLSAVLPNEDSFEGYHPFVKTRRKASIGLHAGAGSSLYALNHNIDMFSTTNNGLRQSTVQKNIPPYLKDGMLTPDDFEKIIHYPPFSVGLSARKDLTHNLAVESGIVYNYLYSKFENAGRRQEASLQLHYLGVPVNLVYNVYGGSYAKWHVYLSGGGMVEKGLLSHYVEYRYNSGERKMTISKAKIDGVQCSLLGAIGVDYKIVKDYSLFLEPKVAYYIPNNNQPFNPRTEHPLVFGVNIGLRFTW